MKIPKCVQLLEKTLTCKLVNITKKLLMVMTELLQPRHAALAVAGPNKHKIAKWRNELILNNFSLKRRKRIY